MHKPRSDGEYLLRKLLNTLRRWIEISSHEDDDWYDRHLAYPSNQDSQSRNNITAFDRADFVEKWLFPWRDRLPYLPWWVIPKTGHTCYYCQHLFIDATAMVPDIEHYSRPLSYSEIDAAASDHCLLFSWFLRFLEPYESRLEQRSFILELIPREPYISDIWWINLASNDEDEFDYELHGELGVFVKDGLNYSHLHINAKVLI